MTLEEPLRSFWIAWRGLNGTRQATPWGEVVSDTRYPMVWESNHAAVLRDHEHVTPSGIRAALHPHLRAVGAMFEHVEFWDPPKSCPALEELRSEADHSGTDAVMVYGGRDAGPLGGFPASVEVRELADPGEAFWAVYRSSRDDFGFEMPSEVVDQLVRRDRELLVPAGLRVFGGFVDGELAGFSSLISLAGAGYVDNVVTLPPHRRRGVATATTGLATAAGLASGDRMIHLLTERQSEAQRVYERLGYGVRALVSSVTRRLPSPG